MTSRKTKTFYFARIDEADGELLDAFSSKSFSPASALEGALDENNEQTYTLLVPTEDKYRIVKETKAVKVSKNAK